MRSLELYIACSNAVLIITFWLQMGLISPELSEMMCKTDKDDFAVFFDIIPGPE